MRINLPCQDKLRGVILQVLIDTSGEGWNIDRLVAYQADGPVPILTSAETMTNDLVMYKGYAAVRTTEASCQVLFNPRIIRTETMKALKTAVAAQSSDLVFVGSYHETWDYALHASKSAALAYIEATVASVRRPDGLRSRDVSRTSLERSKFQQLTDVLDLVRARDGVLDTDLVAKLGDITDRYVICRWQPETQVWRIENGGRGFAISRHLDVSRYLPLAQQPSREYGCWLHDSYSEVHDRGEATVADIDALVRTPGVGQKRMRYRRLITPLRDAAGKAMILSTSVRDPSIDLGSDAAASAKY